MNRPEFTAEFKRLTDGFGAPMTTDRAEALWQHLGTRIDLPVWTRTVNLCLLESRYPSRRQLEQAVAEASDAESRKRGGSGRRPGGSDHTCEACRVELPEERRHLCEDCEAEHVTPGYGPWRMGINERMSAESLGPRAVAIILEEGIGRFPHLESDLRREISGLRQMSGWSDVPAGREAQQVLRVDAGAISGHGRAHDQYVQLSRERLAPDLFGATRARAASTEPRTGQQQELMAEEAHGAA